MTSAVTSALSWSQLFCGLCNWQKKAFTQGRHLTPQADRVNPRQVSWLWAELGTHSDRWWCDSPGIENKLKEAFDSKMQAEAAVTFSGLQRVL